MTVKAEPVAIYATPVHFQSTAMRVPPVEQLAGQAEGSRFRRLLRL